MQSVTAARQSQIENTDFGHWREADSNLRERIIDIKTTKNYIESTIHTVSYTYFEQKMHFDTFQI